MVRTHPSENCDVGPWRACTHLCSAIDLIWISSIVSAASLSQAWIEMDIAPVDDDEAMRGMLVAKNNSIARLVAIQGDNAIIIEIAHCGPS